IAGNSVQGGAGGVNTNFWHDGNEEGNYWSDYTGLDNGAGSRTAGDGIGDTDIPHLGLDNYPFINQNGWLYPGTPILSDPGSFDSDGNYTVSWNDNRGTVSYRLEESESGNFASSTAVYEGSELLYQATTKPNRTYYYRLKAFSENYESGWSNIVNITVDWFPAVPENFKAVVYTAGNGLNLSWNKNTIDTKEYELHSNFTGTWKVLETVTHPGYTYNHTGLNDGSRYYYKIRSKDLRDQLSEFSEIISAIPSDSVPPAPPAGLAIKEVSYDYIKLIWNQSTEDDVSGYNIYRGNILNPDWWDLIGNTTKGLEEYTDRNLTELTDYYYVITAFDEILQESDYSNGVTGTTTLGPHGPEINNSLADFAIEEDSYEGTTINLYVWFEDINGDPLIFSCKGQLHINVTIYQSNGTVVLRPEQNWNGQEALTFSASDGQFNISDEVVITVTSVNDAPGPAEITSPTEGAEIGYDEPLTLQGQCGDVDIPFGDVLTFKWTSSSSGEIGEGQNLSNIKLPPGVHEITLQVTDKNGSIATASVTITVLKDTTSEESDELSGIIIPTVAVIIIIIIVIILIVFIRKRKEREEKKEEDERPQTIIQATIMPPAGAEQPPVAAPQMHEQFPVAYPPSDTTITSTPIQTGQQPVMTAEGYPELPPSVYQEEMLQPDYTEGIEWGRLYGVITKESDFGLDIFERVLEKHVGWGLCITRTHPSKLRSSFIMDGALKIWLSMTSEENSVSPGNLTKIAHIISEFIKTHDKTVIILDGLEYLLNNNDFPKVLKFIESVHEKIVLNNAIFIIPINPSTLSVKNFELLEKELSSTIHDPSYSTEKSA
ncbi:MAG: DUF835 domain-containing protein, partial [Thermoplasmata archaeon]